MDAISSIPSLMLFEKEGISIEGLMKRYAILFDKVIFNRRGAPYEVFGINHVAELVSIFLTPQGSLTQRKALGSNKKFRELFVDCWDVVSDADKFEADRYAVINDLPLDGLGDFCFAEIRRENNLSEDSYDFDIDDVKILSGDLYADIGLNFLAVSEGLDVIPNYSPIIGRALTNEITKRNGQCHDLFGGDLLIPNFDSYSWDEILELREDRHIKAFRKVAVDAMEGSKPLDTAIEQRVMSDLFRLARDVKPDVTHAVLNGVGSNLPSPLMVNPLAIALSMKDVKDNMDRDKKYGHVYFIQGMRERKE
ncbi:hypothetical protein [Methylophilus sp. 3sh_L]|uniref:hypothetical protein n=1 Tax=Methylophilus sp. 3sh_L TaxID=3377114 RepID=UPI00398EC6EC